VAVDKGQEGGGVKVSNEGSEKAERKWDAREVEKRSRSSKRKRRASTERVGEGPKWGTLGKAQDRPSAASRNDVWVKSRSAPN
jgi:hypothetical protein